MEETKVEKASEESREEIAEQAVMDLHKVMTPTLNRVAVRLIFESEEYIKGITRVNPLCENYVQVVSKGKNVESVDNGDYVLTRAGLNFEAFEVYGTKIAVISEMDIIMVVDKSVLKEFSSDKAKQATKASTLAN